MEDKKRLNEYLTLVKKHKDIDLKELYSFLIWLDGTLMKDSSREEKDKLYKTLNYSESLSDELFELLKSYLLFKDDLRKSLDKLEEEQEG